MPHFPNIPKIVYEGPRSKNPLAFKHYQPDELVEGKSMRDHLRFAAAYWHVMRNPLADPFGGGTALGRAYRLLERMSEDIDLRIVGENAGARGPLKRMRHAVSKRLEDAGFTVEGHVRVLQNGSYVRYDLPYDPIAKGEGVLRPEIKIEIAAFPICTIPELRSVTSFVGEATGRPAEANDVKCVRLAETAADKFVALGRRAGFAFAGHEPLDHTLVRHVYDISCMDGHYDLDAAVAIALGTMVIESKSDRADNYPDYKSDPRAETLKTYNIMSTHTEFVADYEKLMGDMVYGSRPSFAEAFVAVERFMQKVREA
jgi:hypothetical protein